MFYRKSEVLVTIQPTSSVNVLYKTFTDEGGCIATEISELL